MSNATLADIITKTRKLTGSANSLQITDEDIIEYINSFYLYDFPSKFRSLQLKDMYTINTIRGVDSYPFDFKHWSTLETPAYVEKRLVNMYLSPWPFYGLFFNWQYRERLALGNGTSGLQTGAITNVTQATQAVVTSANHGLVVGVRVTITGVTGMTQLNNNNYTIVAVTTNTFTLNVNSIGFTAYAANGDWITSAYNGTVQSQPLVRSVNNNPIAQTVTSPTAVFATGTYPAATTEPNIARAQNILIEVNTATDTLHVTDDGAGNLIGDVDNTTATGTINYQTGIVTNLNFNAAVPSGAEITIHYNPSNQSIPQAVLFWQNQIVVRPVPDKGYTIEIAAYRRPSQILLGSVDPANPVSTGVPELLSWWETLAAGAAKKIFEDRQDMEGVAMMDKMLQERYSLNETRTYSQLGSQVMPSIFRGQLNGGAGYGGFGGWGADAS